MGWGDKKEMIIAENAVMKREIELLREQITDLKEEKVELKHQLKYTQEALVAKEAPEVYRDQKYEAEMAAREAHLPLTDEEKEAQRLQEKRAEIATQFLREVEEPLFNDADDMIQMLTRATGVPLGETQSLHGNEES